MEYISKLAQFGSKLGLVYLFSCSGSLFLMVLIRYGTQLLWGSNGPKSGPWEPFDLAPVSWDTCSFWSHLILSFPVSSLLKALGLLLRSGNLEPSNVSPGRTVKIVLIPPFGFMVEKTEALRGEVACRGHAVTW